MRNLVEIYNKNKDILRRMKQSKPSKFPMNTARRSSNSDTQCSFDDSSPDNYGYGYLSSRLSGMSPGKREIIEQEMVIKHKQDELRKTLLRN